MIRVFYLLPTIILFTAMCHGQQEITIPLDFIEVTPPEVYKDEWFRLNNRSNNAFEVKLNNGTLDIREMQKRNTCELIISNGTLYGITGGE